MSRIRLIANMHADPHRPYGADERAILSHAAAADARSEIESWPGYAVTPLIPLPGIGRRLRVSEVVYKDESGRFGLGSFKALGGAYGVLRVVREAVRRGTGGADVTARELMDGRYRELVAGLTVSCATDGNHGRSVAWGASMFGCGCVIYLPHHASEGREAAITAYGARTVRVEGTYDDAVRQADRDAAAEGRIVVSDTSYPGYEEVPRTVMQGYSVMAEEALTQLGGRPPTHVFVQAGVGGVAAALIAHMWERFAGERPITVLVEPEGAACLFETVRTGRLTPFPGEPDTMMACLSCAEASPLAWAILKHGADFAATIPDMLASEGMRLMADGADGDPPIVAGESAVAGVMAALELAADPALRETVRLTEESRVLFIGTEGATDPVVYETIVGRPPGGVGSAA